MQYVYMQHSLAHKYIYVYMYIYMNSVYFKTGPGSQHVPDWVWSVSGLATFSAYALGKNDETF